MLPLFAARSPTPDAAGVPNSAPAVQTHLGVTILTLRTHFSVALLSRRRSAVPVSALFGQSRARPDAPFRTLNCLRPLTGEGSFRRSVGRTCRRHSVGRSTMGVPTSARAPCVRSLNDRAWVPMSNSCGAFHLRCALRSSSQSRGYLFRRPHFSGSASDGRADATLNWVRAARRRMRGGGCRPVRTSRTPALPGPRHVNSNAPARS